MSIEVKNLTHIYMKGSPFEKKALDDININIPSGQFVGIIGPTGSGKSTLIQHFNGLLKPDSGQIYVNGMDVSGNNLKKLRKEVGIVFQYPEHQLFEETVYKDISFGLEKQELKPEIIKQRVYETIRRLGLNEDILDKSPFELSGGQKRRVAIAGVLVMKPSILILDEPTAGLDPSGRDEIYTFISKLHKENKMTILLVSHSMEDIAELTQRVIVMYKGKIEIDGTPGEVFKSRQKLESMGLSVPQISYFMNEVKKFIPDLNENIFTVQDAKEELIKYLKK